jgi:hypothetical protein
LKKEKEEEVYSDGKIRNDLNDWLELANTWWNNWNELDDFF